VGGHAAQVVRSRRVSLAKAMTWRVAATSLTAGVSLAVVGEWHVAGAIAVIDGALKLGAYYVHERAWERLG